MCVRRDYSYRLNSVSFFWWGAEVSIRYLYHKFGLVMHCRQVALQLCAILHWHVCRPSWERSWESQMHQSNGAFIIGL